MLHVKNLNKTIQQKPILQNLSFEVHRGKIAIFIGHSGVGKSTLLRICNRLENYDFGTFYLDKKLLDLPTANKNHRVGMVFQHFNLFEHLTVLENVTLAMMKCQLKSKQQAIQEALALLAEYGLENHIYARVQTLSGGQKQRLAIVRTVALNPDIICMDEPTSALDPKLTQQVASFITKIAQNNRIVLLTTHDISLMRALHARLYLMQAGTIVTSATTTEYFAEPHKFPDLMRFLEN